MEYMRYSVSDTAEYGDYTRGPRVIDRTREGRDEARSWPRSRTASFAREWILENQAGRPHFNALRRRTRSTRSSRSARRCAA